MVNGQPACPKATTFEAQSNVVTISHTMRLLNLFHVLYRSKIRYMYPSLCIELQLWTFRHKIPLIVVRFVIQGVSSHSQEKGNVTIGN